MLSDVFFKLKLKDGYLLKILDDGKFEIHHENGNGVIKFNDRLSLLEYAMQINEEFEILDSNGINLEK